MTHHNYIISGGKKGSDRLTALANATWSTSQSFLLRAGLTPGMRCLDLGCGNGEISLRLAALVGETGSVHGVDMDATNITIARDEAIHTHRTNVSFSMCNLETERLNQPWPCLWSIQATSLANNAVMLSLGAKTGASRVL